MSHTVSEFNRGLFTNKTIKYRVPQGNGAVIASDYLSLMNIACKHPIFLSSPDSFMLLLGNQEVNVMLLGPYGLTGPMYHHAVTRNLAL